MWSERWDRLDRDVAAAQAEISEQISNRLGGVNGLIQEAGRAVARRKRGDDLTGYELYLLGTGQLASGTRAGAAEAVGAARRAVELDPGFARARAELALAHASLAEFGVDRDANRAQALEAAAEAVSLDPGDAWTHAAHGVALRQAGELVRARAELDTAVTMARNAAEILTLYAGWAATADEPERGVGDGRPGGAARPGLPAPGGRAARQGLLHGRPLPGGAGDDRAPARGRLHPGDPGDARRRARRGRPDGGRGRRGRGGADGDPGILDRGDRQRARPRRGRAAAAGRDHASRRLSALRRAAGAARRSATPAGLRRARGGRR